MANIGAHMEKEVNLIIDVEPDEAKKLIKFIENLIGLTYIEKYNHKQLLKKINTISTEKTRKRQNK